MTFKLSFEHYLFSFGPRENKKKKAEKVAHGWEARHELAERACQRWPAKQPSSAAPAKGNGPVLLRNGSTPQVLLCARRKIISPRWRSTRRHPPWSALRHSPETPPPRDGCKSRAGLDLAQICKKPDLIQA